MLVVCCPPQFQTSMQWILMCATQMTRTLKMASKTWTLTIHQEALMAMTSKALMVKIAVYLGLFSIVCVVSYLIPCLPTHRLLIRTHLYLYSFDRLLSAASCRVDPVRGEPFSLLSFAPGWSPSPCIL